jgi:alkylhydroperoxidase family enzyme
MGAKFQTKLDDLDQRLLRTAGTLDPAMREAAASGDGIPEELTRYVDKVRRHAHKVTDQDIHHLLEAGYSEDQIFELTVAAAYGAARMRLDRGLDALAGRSVPSTASTEGGSP